MYVGKTPLAQLMGFLPWSTFFSIVARYGGDHQVRSLPCTDQFRALVFVQLTYRESLRDIEACLAPQSVKLCHMGIRSLVAGVPNVLPRIWFYLSAHLHGHVHADGFKILVNYFAFIGG